MKENHVIGYGNTLIGGYTIELILQSNMPGSGCFFASACSGGYCGDPTESVCLITNLPEEHDDLNVLPAENESVFWGSWDVLYIGRLQDGEYRLSCVNNPDGALVISEGQAIAGQNSPVGTRFVDGKLVIDDLGMTFEMTKIGALMNRNSKQSVVEYWLPVE